ncbi:ATP-grasp domain-containing protein [Streptomyces uncialis]|uniref:ATP-grasp domain-containing protein n=1 Tax=Streptomyces uncialis TaxID=1048205 RepID=UPI0037B1DE22
MPGTRALFAVAPWPTVTRELLADTARRRGMDVEVPVPGGGRTGRAAHYYGGPGFAAGVVDGLGVALLEPDADWLPRLPREWTGRRIATTDLAAARRLTRPAFLKPPTAKTFPAAVYPDGRDLAPGLPPDTPVQMSEVVRWAAEYRLFVLDGTVRTGSRYATHGLLDAAPLAADPRADAVSDFAARLLAGHAATLPSAVVLDVGLLAGDEPGWAVVEANMAWFSTCYAADPERCLDVVLRAAGPRDRIRDGDRRFAVAGRGAR